MCKNFKNISITEIRGNFLQKTIIDLIILCKLSINKKLNKVRVSSFGDIIPKNENRISPDDFIPWLFYRKKGSRNFLNYFQGNS